MWSGWPVRQGWRTPSSSCVWGWPGRAPAASSGSSSHSSTLTTGGCRHTLKLNNLAWSDPEWCKSVQIHYYTSTICLLYSGLSLTQDIYISNCGIPVPLLLGKKTDFTHKKLPVFGIGDLAVIISVADPNFSIPDPGSKRFRIPDLHQRKMFLSSRKYEPGCLSRIWIF